MIIVQNPQLNKEIGQSCFIFKDSLLKNLLHGYQCLDLRVSVTDLYENREYGEQSKIQQKFLL